MKYTDLTFDENSIFLVTGEAASSVPTSARQTGVKKFVYASSSSVYGDHPVLPKVEGQEGNLLSSYALTKHVCEEYFWGHE